MQFAQPTGNGDNVAVMVSFARIRAPIDKMVMYIEGQALQAGYPMEEDTIRTILFESLNEYLQFTLPTIPRGENCSFEHYLDTRFQAIAQIVNPTITESNPNPNKSGIMFLNAQWAIAVGELARQLIPGIRDLNAWGQDCGELQVFTLPESPSFDRAMDERRTQVHSAVYVLSGIQYEDVDMESEAL